MGGTIPLVGASWLYEKASWAWSSKRYSTMVSSSNPSFVFWPDFPVTWKCKMKQTLSSSKLLLIQVFYHRSRKESRASRPQEKHWGWGWQEHMPRRTGLQQKGHTCRYAVMCCVDWKVSAMEEMGPGLQHKHPIYFIRIGTYFMSVHQTH